MLNKKEMLDHLVNSMGAWPTFQASNFPIHPIYSDVTKFDNDWKWVCTKAWTLVNSSLHLEINEHEFNAKKQDMLSPPPPKDVSRKATLEWAINHVHAWPSKVIVNGKTLPLDKFLPVPPDCWRWDQNNVDAPVLFNPVIDEIISKGTWEKYQKKSEEPFIELFKKAIDNAKNDTEGNHLLLTEPKIFDRLCKLIPELAENVNTTNGYCSQYKGIKIRAFQMETILLFHFMITRGINLMFQDFIDDKMPESGINATTIIESLVNADE